MDADSKLFDLNNPQASYPSQMQNTRHPKAKDLQCDVFFSVTFSPFQQANLSVHAANEKMSYHPMFCCMIQVFHGW